MVFPAEFEKAILETEIVMQNKLTMTYLSDAVQVQADTRVLQSKIQKNILISQAIAKANSTLELQYGIANATKIIADNEADALQYLKVKTKKILYYIFKDNFGFH